MIKSHSSKKISRLWLVYNTICLKCSHCYQIWYAFFSWLKYASIETGFYKFLLNQMKLIKLILR